MNLDDLNYHLPEELIAQEPLAERDASRLLNLDRHSGEIFHRQFREVTEILEPGDLLIMNNTRVNALRVYGQKPSGAKVEALLITETEPGTFKCLLKPAKKFPPGSIIQFEQGLTATVTGETDGGQRILTFTQTSDWRETLHEISLAPVPPYIHTPLADRSRYQTVIAQTDGSAAAPTAGLHFTQSILDHLVKKGIDIAEVTLHVGLDTFRPIQSDTIADHEMHGEQCEIPAATAKKVAECKGRIIAVGTTTVRTLETFATGKRQLTPGKTVSKLFINPGFDFKIVDGMFTNFHMPRTTMLLMISALATPESIRLAYKEAVNLRYRFLSFGDSMLIL
ncbi:tRNA preQ1(34) S-adenosylmethionine ribosyltransferase-isomerase QueA [bacterium]|nr:tRNA preQ1(34) S-adenosylmethionine ribosyltransferase-isomerase QueA [bacterium]